MPSLCQRSSVVILITKHHSLKQACSTFCEDWATLCELLCPTHILITIDFIYNFMRAIMIRNVFTRYYVLFIITRDKIEGRAILNSTAGHELDTSGLKGNHILVTIEFLNVSQISPR